MPRVPFIGRLFLHEYIALFGSLILIGLETFIRTVTLALPGPIIRFCYKTSRQAFNSLSSPQGRISRNKKRAIVSSIAQANDFVELCELFGYYAEEHIVQTGDGYLLGLHRLGWRKGEEDKRVNSGEDSIKKKVVYLHHGLMMNSEVWVCLTEKERCLPFVLVDKGYDVWLGNNRGNKYSKKSVYHSPTEIPFWNFSMDQFAFHDIPDSIDYILSTTSQPSLSYIGFSQGTAQAFATLSIHPNLNDRVDVFIALAPAMAPPGLASGIVASFVKSSPEVLFLAFGRRAIFGAAAMWQALLYPAIFTSFIDFALKFLFGWHCRNMSPHQKLAAYPHLYSFTSTKSVVHWFQIIRNSTFQMYDDEVQAPFSLTDGSKYYKVAKFPTRNIKTPIVLMYGGSDSLVDIKLMLRELPKHTVAKEIAHYEHLDFLWASDVDALVFPHVLDALTSYALPEQRKLGSRETGVSRPTLSPGQPPTYSEAERVPEHLNLDEDERFASNIPSSSFRRANSPFGPTLQASNRLYRASTNGTPPRTALKSSKVKPPNLLLDGEAKPPFSSNDPLSPRARRRISLGSTQASHITEKSSVSRPEGWWSSDEVAGTESSSPVEERKSLSVTPISTLPSSTHHPAMDTEHVASSYARSHSVRSSDASFGDHQDMSLASRKLVAEAANQHDAGLTEQIWRETASGNGSTNGKYTKKKARVK
ncbi:cholesterol esterase [Elasticomyces elasticus]|nr:cholesterol esterase [Elasticomyces elasticus]